MLVQSFSPSLLTGLCLLSLSVELVGLLPSSPLLLAVTSLLLVASMRRTEVKVLSLSSPPSSSPSQCSSSSLVDVPSSSSHHRRRHRRLSRVHPYDGSERTSSSSARAGTTSPTSLSMPSSSPPSFPLPNSSDDSSSPQASAAASYPPAAPCPTAPLSLFHSNSSSSYPGLAYTPYVLQHTLQHSLFGAVKLAYHAITKQPLCIKLSLLSFSITGQTIHGGARVSEDVRREAALLRYLQGGVGVVELIEELEDDLFHYLVLEFAGQDLFVVLQRLPIPVSSQVTDADAAVPASVVVDPVACVPEVSARPLFRQLLQAVQYCHSRGVALFDLSLENVCVNGEGRVRVIDLGLAQLHPAYLTDVRGRSRSSAEELGRFLLPSSDPSSPLSGKVQYLSPEAYAHSAFDAFAQDRYACGIVLYTLLIGRPPYFLPVRSDFWYGLISSGEWRGEAMQRSNVGRALFGQLSEAAVEVLDGLLKPEEKRWTWERINRCQFMTDMAME